MLVRRVLRTSGIRVRDPDRAQAEHVGKGVVGQRSAEIGKNRRRAPGRALDRTGGEINPRILRIEPAGAENAALAAAHLDFLEAVAVEVAAQRRNDVVHVRPHHVTQLAMGAGMAGNGVDWTIRGAGGEGQHLEAVPGEYALSRRELRFSPIAVDRRAVPAAVDLDVGKQALYRRRQRRAPFRHLDRAACIGDASERMREDDTGIGEQAAPVAGMMSALAQIDDEIDWVAAARSEKDRRPIGRDPRAVRGNQQIRLQELMLVLGAKLAQSGGADFLSHLDQNFGVEAEAAALGDDRGECGDVDAVLSLVVGGAAAVKTRALDGQHPGRKAAPPQIVEAAYRIAVAVDQNGDRGVVLLAFRYQERRARRVVENARREAERSEARHHLVVEITAQRTRALRLLARAGDGDPPPQIDEKFSAVEIAVCASDGGGAAHDVALARLRA